MSNFVEIDNNAARVQEYLRETDGEVEKNIDARNSFNNIKDDDK